MHPFAGRLIARTPRPVRAPVELVVRVAVESSEDRIAGLAAEVAFFALLSLPPLLLTIVAALGFLPGDPASEFVSAIVRWSGRIFTRQTVEDVISPLVRALVTDTRPDVLSISFALSLLAASRAVRVVLTTVAIAYDLEGFRPSWRQRAQALALTLGLFLSVPVVVPLVLAGPDLGRALADSDLVPAGVAGLWPAVYWAGLGSLTVVMIAALYHLAAPWWTPFRRDLPGAVLAVAVWVASSAGLRVYTRNALVAPEGETSIYGLLAGPIALLVWLYLLAFGVLLGGELNAELERLHPSPEHRRIPAGERLRRLWATMENGRRGGGAGTIVTATPVDEVDSADRGSS